MKKNYKDIIDILLKNGVGILPTDTLYGLVGQAFSKKAVERISRLKNRKDKNPFIILISSHEDLNLFGIKIDKVIEDILRKYWPGKVSIILPCNNEELAYLHMGTKSLAFRMPDKRNLLSLLKETGPLVAPSANYSGEKPALTIEEARVYFSNEVDFYADEEKTESLPSTLIKIENGKIMVLREGAVKV